MKRFLNKVFEGDCLEIMPLIPEKSVDMILCDLPYGTTQNKWDVIIPFEPLWKEYKRIVKDNGAIILTGAQPFITDLINSNREMFKYDLIWYKPLGSGHLNCNKMPMRNHEHILVFYNDLPTYNPQMMSGKMRDKGSRGHNGSSNYGEFKPVLSRSDKYFPQSVINITNGDRTKESEHPTQKPLELFTYLINTFSNEGDTVLDNCAGSGTTAEACLETKRNYIVIEKEKKYVDIINNRILRFKEQGRLF